MVVRIPLKIENPSKGVVVKTSALINSGYEADKPEILIPHPLAGRLGISLEGSVSEARCSVFGVGTLIRPKENLVKVSVVTGDRVLGPVEAYVLVSNFEVEVLISDYLASLLRIAVEDFKRGLWRFRDEPLGRVRESEKPTYWIHG